jgi:hypothetical protein
LVLGLCLGAAVGWVSLGQPANAVTVPEWGRSWYFTESASVAEDKGCSLGQEAYNTPGTQQYVVVLAFGTMINTSNGWKFNQFSLPNITDDQAKVRAQRFAKGFYWCASGDLSSYVRIGIGTSNSGGNITFNAGKAMANRVGEGNAWLDDQGYFTQAGIFGANDIELDWSSPTTAMNWVDGYNNNTSTDFYDTGDAAGCATGHEAGSECGTQAQPGWGASDVWYVSDFANAVPLPQIYTENESMAKQWKWLSVYAYNHKGSRMNIRGSATQHGACAQNGPCSGTNNTAADGYTQLFDALDSNSKSRQPAASLLATDWKWTNP